jgi:hypothetical protein
MFSRKWATIAGDRGQIWYYKDLKYSLSSILAHLHLDITTVCWWSISSTQARHNSLFFQWIQYSQRAYCSTRRGNLLCLKLCYPTTGLLKRMLLCCFKGAYSNSKPYVRRSYLRSNTPCISMLHDVHRMDTRQHYSRR